VTRCSRCASTLLYATDDELLCLSCGKGQRLRPRCRECLPAERHHEPRACPVLQALFPVDNDRRPGRKPVVRVLPDGRWVGAYTRCESCLTTERPYHGRGLCQRCHARIATSERRGAVAG
jgi:hypothetical protein